MESSPASRMTRQVFCFSLRYLQLFYAHSRAQLVSQSFGFISTAIRSGAYCDIFEASDTIRGLIAGVAAPDLALRTRDVEVFRGYVSRIRTRRAACLGGRYATASRC